MDNLLEGFMPCCDNCIHTTVDCTNYCLTYRECMIMIEENDLELLDIVGYYREQPDGDLPF